MLLFMKGLPVLILTMAHWFCWTDPYRAPRCMTVVGHLSASKPMAKMETHLFLMKNEDVLTVRDV